MNSTDTGLKLRSNPVRLFGMIRDLGVGSLLCLTPLTSLIALGWLTRRMAATINWRWDHVSQRAGWVLGPRGTGWFTRGFGGIGANIRVGIQTVIGLAILTLPFSAAWLGAWWAGWENSFNKGYEQAAIGPIVWLSAALLAVVSLTHLPFALAHAASEGRVGAFFEFRRIRSVVIAAGWRSPWLAFLSVTLSLPLVASRAFTVFVEGIIPGFADMGIEERDNVASLQALLTAVYGFGLLQVLRNRAAVFYAYASLRAAKGRNAALWVGHICASKQGCTCSVSWALSAFWLSLSCAIWFGLVVQIVIMQFVNYDPWLWLTHPVYLLPWFG